MSQYPSPYSPPQYQYSYAAYDPAQQYLQPAKSAGILMIVLGGTGLLLGLCMGLVAVMFPQMRDQIDAQQMAPILDFEKQSGMNASALFYIVSGFILVPAIAFIIVGPFVRKGGAGAIITAIVMTVLVLLLSVFYLLASLIKASPLEGCFGLVGTGLLILELYWLIKAIRNNKLIEQMRYAYQMQMWQYQQQAQAYNTSAYQQNYPPAPAPPPPGPSGVDDGASPPTA